MAAPASVSEHIIPFHDPLDKRLFLLHLWSCFYAFLWLYALINDSVTRTRFSDRLSYQIIENFYILRENDGFLYLCVLYLYEGSV